MKKHTNHSKRSLGQSSGRWRGCCVASCIRSCSAGIWALPNPLSLLRCWDFFYKGNSVLDWRSATNVSRFLNSWDDPLNKINTDSNRNCLRIMEFALVRAWHHSVFLSPPEGTIWTNCPLSAKIWEIVPSKIVPSPQATPTWSVLALIVHRIILRWCDRQKSSRNAIFWDREVEKPKFSPAALFWVQGNNACQSFVTLHGRTKTD